MHAVNNIVFHPLRSSEARRCDVLNPGLALSISNPMAATSGFPGHLSKGPAGRRWVEMTLIIRYLGAAGEMDIQPA